MAITRRSFLAGIGSVTVGLLFTRKLDRVLGELEAESLADEPEVAGQLPAAATVSCVTDAAFRPHRLVVYGARTIGKRMVECLGCEGLGERVDGSVCSKCEGVGYARIDTGATREEDVVTIPWVLQDIVIGQMGQLAGDGELPADLFAPAAIESNLLLDAAAPGHEIRFKVRYVGDRPEGERFRAALLGTTIRDGHVVQCTMPIESDCNIVGASTARAA